MFRKLVMVGACVALGLGASPASAEEIFLKITTPRGVVGGWENPVGALGETSLEDYAKVQAFKWSVTVPIDLGSHQATGRRQHRPVEVRVPMAGGVVDGLVSLKQNDRVTVEVLWMGQGEDGIWAPQRAMTLEQAVLLEVSLQTVGEGAASRTMADLNIVYNVIGITDFVHQMSFTDILGSTSL